MTVLVNNGGAARYRPEVRSAYYERVYVHSSKSMEKISRHRMACKGILICQTRLRSAVLLNGYPLSWSNWAWPKRNNTVRIDAQMALVIVIFYMRHIYGLHDAGHFQKSF